LRFPNEVSRDAIVGFKALWHLNILNAIRKLLPLYLPLSSNIHTGPQQWYRYEIPSMALHLTHFSLSKTSLCMWISTYLLVKNKIFFYVTHLFYRHVPNSTRNKNMKSQNPNLLRKLVFLASKTLLSPLSIGKKLFFQLWMLWSCKLSV
jgi:hypothetical protein